MAGPRKSNTSNTREPPGDYPVGWGRPPVDTQFKPGQSGNPKGRPKGRKKLGRILEDILYEQVSMREGNKVRKVSKAEAMLRAVVLKALQGDQKAFKTLVSLGEQSGQFEPEPEPIETIMRVLITPDGKYHRLPSAGTQDCDERTPFEFKPGEIAPPRK